MEPDKKGPLLKVAEAAKKPWDFEPVQNNSYITNEEDEEKKREAKRGRKSRVSRAFNQMDNMNTLT